MYKNKFFHYRDFIVVTRYKIFIFRLDIKMDKDIPLWKAMEEDIASRDSRDPVFWKEEFGDQYGLVEPERKEWLNQEEYRQFKLE